MAKKQFKAESKKLMDLMINSIYTNKEIFLREIISNASDAIDKLHYESLTNKDIKVNAKDFEIFVKPDKEKHTLTITDNGCGMTKEELENNLGTIAKSGSLAFKEEKDPQKDIDIIGQFGVGFYSAFMVASKIEVISKAYGSEEAYKWVSEGIDGYTIEKASKDTYGTDIILTLKEDTEDEKYSEYLEEYRLRGLIKKYSDYITYPIKMEVTHSHLKEGTENEYESHTEIETLNDMVPLWKRDKKKIKEEDYDTFYSDKFMDYEKPLKVIHTSAEGLVSFNSLLFIPSHAPYDFYTKTYEKGLQLYSNGVLIMENCADLLPDYFSFVKGVVDSPDLSLNISREMLQQDKNLKLIAKNIEAKIIKELTSMMKEDKENYEKFFKTFGATIKYGIYENFGMHKDKLQDLIIFASSYEDKMTSLKDYVSRMKENQDAIYYACGETTDKIKLMPQVEQVTDKGYEILYCTEYVDEFTFQSLREYESKKFVNICKEDLNLDTPEEKEELQKLNEDSKDLLATMKESLKDISGVKFTNRLKNHPVCLVSEGDISIEMEKVINAMPTDEKINANKVLEINANHKIAEKLKTLYETDKEALKDYTKILYAEARLIEGLPIENPTELASLICVKLAN
uniref:molecular chaperone HtpG n=1 Tax=Candidatus Ventrenecus sp. TaxID=3085654 RepID=UPI004026D882